MKIDLFWDDVFENINRKKVVLTSFMSSSVMKFDAISSANKSVSLKFKLFWMKKKYVRYGMSATMVK